MRESRTIARQRRKGPVRTCVGCGQRVSQGELLRMALVGDQVQADPRREFPGRGAYLHLRRRCLERLLLRGVRKQYWGRPLSREAWTGFQQFVEKDLGSDPAEKG